MPGTIFLTKPWDTIIAEFLANHTGAPKTRSTYERALRPWLDFLKKEDKGLDIPLISRYKRLLDGRELSGHTVAAYITAVRTLLDWMVKTGQIEYNPAKEISKLKRPDSSRDALTEQELVKLLVALEHLEPTPENIRNKAILFLMLYTGLREISIINADIGDIKSKAGKYILFYRPKGTTFKDKFVVLETPPYEAINKYLDQRGQYDAKTPLFASYSHRNSSGRLTTRTIHRIIAGCYKRAGIRRPGIQPHSLRHCAGTFAAMRGGDPRQIKDMLGHSKVETSMGYTHSQDRVTNSGAHHMVIPKPDAEDIARVMVQTIEDAGLKPEQIDYINAHGTSTDQNDRAETKAIKQVFKDYAYKLPISSTKSMTGHSIGAAGAIEAAVSCLTIKHQIIPPTINYEEKDPDCDLDYVPNKARKTKIQNVLSNSFGFGSNNACLMFRGHNG